MNVSDYPTENSGIICQHPKIQGAILVLRELVAMFGEESVWFDERDPEPWQYVKINAELSAVALRDIADGMEAAKAVAALESKEKQ